MASEAGKGSGSRPMEVPREVYESNHDRIFGKRERKQYVPPPLPEQPKEPPCPAD